MTYVDTMLDRVLVFACEVPEGVGSSEEDTIIFEDCSSDEVRNAAQCLQGLGIWRKVVPEGNRITFVPW